MGRRDGGDDWRRKREREDEQDADFERKRNLKQGGAPGALPGSKRDSFAGPAPAGDDNQKLTDLLDRIPPMIEQLNNLYNMYFSGAERLPPIERRSLLDAAVLQLTNLPKPTPALTFRATNLIQTYNTNRDRWDRKLRELETGTRKRGG